MIIVITGPTCTSKSKIAINVALAFNAEIVNADAFQIYKELDIGTAKPDPLDLKKVKHHLYNFLSPSKRYSIFQYQKDARKIIDDILKRGKNVVLVGGSGLYIRAALYDYKFLEKPQKEVDLSDFYNLTNEELHHKLEEVDPKEAKKIHPNNRKRVLRALYIYLAYNKTKSEIEALQEHKIIYDDVHIYAIDMDKKVLYERIDKRVESMISKGLIKEAINLQEKYGNDIQAFNAIGYHEIVNNLVDNATEITKQIQKDTRNYAKRQVTFIRYQYGNNFKWVNNDLDIINDLTKSSINSRSNSLIGEDKMDLIKKSRVAVFGIGGVGGTAAEALIRSGIINLTLIDYDTVNVTNLNRQILFNNLDLKIDKVDAAKKHLLAINPNAHINIYNRRIDSDSLSSFQFENFDYVIDAIDSTNNKVGLIKYMLEHKVNFISSLGMGNRFDLTKIKITTLDKTHDDPLARKIRNELKKDKIDLRKINVVCSEEVPIKGKNEISSMIFVPSTAGLLLASYVINKIINKGE